MASRLFCVADARPASRLRAMQSFGESIWLKSFHFTVLGMDLGKTTTLIRLRSGKLVLHSAGPFTDGDVAAMQALGEVGWLVEANCLHDTFSARARACFPNVPYLVPSGFPLSLKGMRPLDPPPPEWADELLLFPIEGMPRVNEMALLHRPSGTLVLGDLLFNFPEDTPRSLRLFLQWVSGVRTFPGSSRLVRFMIRDRARFKVSIERILETNFGKVIVAHKVPIEAGGRQALEALLRG